MSNGSWYILNVAMGATAGVPLSVITEFDQEVVSGGAAFWFPSVSGNSNGTAFAMTYAFSMPANAAAPTTIAYIPSSTPTLTGTISIGSALSGDVALTLQTPGGSVPIGIIFAGTTSAPVLWAATGEPGFAYDEVVARAKRAARGGGYEPGAILSRTQ